MAHFEKVVPKFLQKLSNRVESQDRIENPTKYREEAPDRPDREDEKPVVVNAEEHIVHEEDLKEKMLEQSRKKRQKDDKEKGKVKEKEKKNQDDGEETKKKKKKSESQRKNEFVLSFKDDAEL
jgi:ATP-dependent RNA helicase DDX46/PRP5